MFHTFYSITELTKTPQDMRKKDKVDVNLNLSKFLEKWLAPWDLLIQPQIQNFSCKTNPFGMLYTH